MLSQLNAQIRLPVEDSRVSVYLYGDIHDPQFLCIQFHFLAIFCRPSG